MKLVVIALIVVLVVTVGEALVCNRCVPAKAGQRCAVTQETCSASKDTCISARFLTPPYGYFQRCISKVDCMLLQNNSYMKIKCCQKDLCNVPV
ncbi:CD59 glycoprotein-like [Denticeps clupeoides]|uniref:Snake toxin/toxin-like domain-containing protein n=1 Tax=Denticeps clupeoides TaxID=299321 RepID=A0AAY4EW92_9TELE|nr:CD59 glycoprotein-like [Denticeps clupeoides]